MLACSATLGPCYYNTGLVRRDITETSNGKIGMPTRLGFRILNADSGGFWGLRSSDNAFAMHTWGYSTDVPVAGYDSH